MPPWLSFLLVALFAWLLIPLLIDSLLRAMYVVVSWGADFPLVGQDRPASPCLAVLIPAHDEAAVIGKTLETLLGYARPEQVFLVADRCHDDTVTIGLRLGVQVLERGEDDGGGKAAVLRWCFEQTDASLETFSHVLVLDADSEIQPGFFSELNAVIASGVRAGQCLACSPPQTGPLAVQAAFSELLSHKVDDVARHRLGWSVPLRGRGMVFERRLLESLVGDLCTRVEDVELSLLLAASRVTVRFVPGAILRDAKPPSVTASSRQRARWLQGQRQVWQQHWRRILSLLTAGRAQNLSLVFATLIKPKTLLLALKSLWLLLALLLPLQPLALRWAVATGAALAWSIDVAYYLLGLRLADDRARCAVSLALAPAYLLVWLGSLCLSWVSRAPWLRTTSR